MMGKDSINLGLGNIWECWFSYRKGKQWSRELHEFQYNLEDNISKLCRDLNDGNYKHGPYKTFMVSDNKRREISVASIRDRIVHRMLYDYLIPIWDMTFISDVWSCRKGKGLLGAIERAQMFLKNYTNSYVWRADVKKFFDHVDHQVLLKILTRRVRDSRAYNLLEKVIRSYDLDKILGGGRGIPIGNLTSQIFSNIYLNELDRFVKYDLKVKAYLRYGDDFIILDRDQEKLNEIRKLVGSFLVWKLKLEFHSKNDLIIKANDGVWFLGVGLYPGGRRLNDRNRKRILSRLDLRNSGSYLGIVKLHENQKFLDVFNWTVLDRICSL